MNKIFLTFITLYACVAAQSRDFTSVNYASGAAEYLKLPIHASSAALGSAVVASRNDLANVQYNPAILDALPQGEMNIVGTYSILTLDRRHNGLDFAGNAGNYFVYGISYLNYGVGKIDGRDTFGIQTGMFDYAANAITASAAGRVTNNIALGATLRYINESLSVENVNGIGFDIGATYLPLPFLSFGASVQNLGSYLWWSTGTREAVLPAGRIGVCGNLLKKTLLIETDFIKTQTQPEEVAAGIQYYFLDLLYVRGGINTAVAVEKQSSKYPDYSLGLGMRYLSLGFDYACQIPDSRSLESVLGIKHKLTLCASIKNF
jgi:hypothetical protein